MTTSSSLRLARAHPRLASIIAWTFGIALSLIIPFARFGHKGLAPLLVAFGLIGIAYWAIRRGEIKVTLLTALSALFVALTVASAIWSYTPGVTLKTSTSLIGTSFCAYALFYLVANLEVDLRHLAIRIFVYGGLLGLTVLIIDVVPQEINDIFVRGRSVYDSVAVQFWNERKPTLSIATLLIWPWAAAAWRILPRYVTLGALALYVVVLAAGEADAARTSILISFIAGLSILVARKATLRISAAALAVLILVMPLIPKLLTDPLSTEARYEGFSPSALHRIVIWQTAAEKIPDNPILGSGFDTTRALYPSGSGRWITMLPGTAHPLEIVAEPIPLHPHNMFLQIWVELGAVGAITAAIFLCGIIYTIGKYCRPDRVAAIAFGVFVSCLFIANVSFGAWQAWWVATLIIVGAITTMVLKSDMQDYPPKTTGS